MSEHYNLDLCPECDSDLTPVDSFDETQDEDVGPIQGYRLECESDDCDHDCITALLHYPNSEYVGVWEAYDETCECGNDATYGIERVGKPPLYQCGYCAFDLYTTAYVDAVRYL